LLCQNIRVKEGSLFDEAYSELVNIFAGLGLCLEGEGRGLHGGPERVGRRLLGEAHLCNFR